LEDHCECEELPKDDLEPYLLRVGWSLNRTSLQLGESEFSYGYCSSGKICHNKVFEDFGEPFEKGDSIGSYLVRKYFFIGIGLKLEIKLVL
jgi:hypothetical protein